VNVSERSDRSPRSETKRPGGYDAVLQERGAGLSTGQKQLLALARSIAQDPDILLILDEATANVDTETEWLIQDALKKLMKGRTSIIIAHRLSTIRHVDRTLVMRHGEIVEQGSHNELMAADGYYKRLYDLLSHHPAGR
jgi:ATP-binding cassette, subfamily B, multidrug efflux pump